MTALLSPDSDMATSTNSLSAQMSASLLTRRSSRSSGSQCGGPRSSRIEKPRSNHNSPRTAERRKTTSSSTKRYATLDDHFNMMFGISGGEEEDQEEDKKDASRPMSWHPSSAQFQVPSRSSVMSEHPHNYTAPSRNSAHGSDFYSLSARNSMYTEQLQTHTSSSQGTHRGSQDSDNSFQSQQSGSYAYSSLSTPATESMPWYLQEWTRKNNTAVTDSRNGSSEFLPIQHPPAIEADDEDMEEDSGKELVGMGLYDLPDSSLSWNSSTLLEGTGKGLKLEETWQPPEEDEDDDEDDEEQDASSDDGSDEELPTAKEDAQLPLHNGNTKPQVSSNMEGQSFFFDEDETYKTEWWFRQLKQPSVPVRDAGLGYGWL